MAHSFEHRDRKQERTVFFSVINSIPFHNMVKVEEKHTNSKTDSHNVLDQYLSTSGDTEVLEIKFCINDNSANTVRL